MNLASILQPLFCAIALWLCGTAATLGDAAPSSPSAKPNILVIVADDLGWADVGYHGSDIPTPEIDRLAAEGVILEQHYVAPMCTPTRTALLTGRYWSRFGNRKPSNERVLPWKTPTLASLLRSGGYLTALTGKWHLGSHPDWGPHHFGFDHVYGCLAGGVGPWNHRYKKGAYTESWHEGGRLMEETGHVTDLLANEAVRTIHRAQEDTRPWFLYLPFTAPHHPLDEPGIWLERARPHTEPSRLQYVACVMHLDHAIGRVRAAIEKTGQSQNTIILFFSDNGGTIQPADGDNARYPGTYPPDQRLGENGPLRGRKGQLYEGGIRVPTLIHWPGHFAPRRVNAPVHVIDWAPTLAQLAQTEVDAEDLKWDGENLGPLLKGGEDAALQNRSLYWQGVRETSAALRQGDWKLIVDDASEDAELFHLAVDPNEQHNLASQEPARVAALRQRLQAERDRDNDALPQSNARP